VRRNQRENADVKLAAVDEQGIRDVFLDDHGLPLPPIILHKLLYLIQSLRYVDTMSTVRILAWFQYPDILCFSCQFPLPRDAKIDVLKLVGLLIILIFFIITIIPLIRIGFPPKLSLPLPIFLLSFICLLGLLFLFFPFLSFLGAPFRGNLFPLSDNIFQFYYSILCLYLTLLVLRQELLKVPIIMHGALLTVERHRQRIKWTLPHGVVVHLHIVEEALLIAQMVVVL
jgi:hypothetical protein